MPRSNRIGDAANQMSRTSSISMHSSMHVKAFRVRGLVDAEVISW